VDGRCCLHDECRRDRIGSLRISFRRGCSEVEGFKGSQFRIGPINRTQGFPRSTGDFL
jgi:hypothetical protein